MTNSSPKYKVRYPEIGICGLSCALCPQHHTLGKSRCTGCKTEYRMAAGCPFITCALKRRGIEFCWDCVESEICSKWKAHRLFGRQHDTFVCYQRLEDNIDFVSRHGVGGFRKVQKVREKLLKDMLQEFNEGRSKTYYSIAATVMEVRELREALSQAREATKGFDVKRKSVVLHSILDKVAKRRSHHLALRK